VILSLTITTGVHELLITFFFFFYYCYIYSNFIIDTPGQIEVFMWSASGQLITDMLASIMPTIILFVVDTPRCKNPSTFMANMLYACSILYKTRLPLVVALNKSDVVPHDFILEWMDDFECFQVSIYILLLIIIIIFINIFFIYFGNSRKLH